MNRRGFIQSAMAGLAALFLPKSKGFGVKEIRLLKEKVGEIKPVPFICFRGYLFSARGNLILWEKLNENGNSGAMVALPTTDRFRLFEQHQDKLFWVGEHETWEIEYHELDLWYRLCSRKPNNENSTSPITVLMAGGCT